jgi:hypothetical protein
MLAVVLVTLLAVLRHALAALSLRPVLALQA